RALVEFVCPGRGPRRREARAPRIAFQIQWSRRNEVADIDPIDRRTATQKMPILRRGIRERWVRMVVVCDWTILKGGETQTRPTVIPIRAVVNSRVEDYIVVCNVCRGVCLITTPVSLSASRRRRRHGVIIII